MTPVQAMFWQIWRGWRWGLILGWAYLAAAAVVAHLLPDILRRTPGGAAFVPNLGPQLALPCILIGIHMAAAFSLTGADLKERGYWKMMFVLPVRTRTLVAWPMIWGCLALGCGWLFLALLVLRPTGQFVPLVWPVAALAAGLTFLQAHSWMPMAQHWLSIVVAVLSMSIVAMIVALVAVFEVPEPVATCFFLGLLPLTWTACLRGVAAARRGDVIDLRVWNQLVDWISEKRKPAEHPFHSASQAQLWFECRCFGWLLPLFVAIVFPFALVLVVLQARNGAPFTMPLLVLLFVPTFLATVIGFQFGNPSFPFVATRPLSSVALVRSKFEMALFSTLAAYIPALVTVPLLFLWPRFFDSALQAAQAAGTPKAATLLLLAVVLPPLLTWKGIAESLWLGLTDRAWLNNAFAFGNAVLFGFGTLFSLWVSFNPTLQALLWQAMPWLIGLLLVVKLIIGIWIVSALVHSRLIKQITAGVLVGSWCVIVAGLCAIAVWLIPGELVRVSGILAGVTLFVPFSRLAGAPLALEWNRHR